MDLVKEFIALITKTEDIKDKILKKSDFDDKSQDARMVALDSINQSISAAGNWIHSYNSLKIKFTTKEKLNRTEFLESLGGRGDAKVLCDTELKMFKFLRDGLITSIHFKFDNLFNNILKHLNPKLKVNGYYPLTQEILKRCLNSDTDAEQGRLTALANLRNSFHGNGIHTKYDLKIEIYGTYFEFIEGKMIDCASWKHIVILLKSNIDVLEKILLSDTVTKITGEIKDKFASLINQTPHKNSEE
jgi:hypothetical protein